jgi:hypothetical protein
VTPRKRRGPAPTGKGTPVVVRMQPEQLAAVAAFAAAQDDAPSQPEAVRRLVDWGLKATLLSMKDRAAFSARFNRAHKSDE